MFKSYFNNLFFKQFKEILNITLEQFKEILNIALEQFNLK